MVALKIEEQKAFTAGLFVGALFDGFLVREANIVTYNSFMIDGRIRPEYYSKEELEEGGFEEYSTWSAVKPFCFSLIKGKRLPESFKIVFLLSPSAKERFMAVHVPGMAPDAAGGLYLNVQYDKQEITCVTGTALVGFLLDRTLEQEWDESVKKWLKKEGIAFLPL
ncbi:MAG: hypothetical protein HFE84_04365 [Lachnospiraceae bacterium]|nr:hypothetical protein [Lachnospiraceae bacterium]